jgi:hypothetical protein
MISSIDILTLRRISFIEIGSYLIELESERGAFSLSLCRVKKVKLKSDSEIELVQTESDEFNQKCSMGLIDSKKIGEAVISFHRCHDHYVPNVI